MKIAVFPGSFDPITAGHIDIAVRAAALFDEVIIAVSDNSEKKTLFTAAERLKMAEIACGGYPNIRAEFSGGLLSEYAAKRGAVTLVKGVRNTADFEYEYWLAAINRGMAERVETVFLPSRAEFQHINSTFVREMIKYGRDISGALPAGVGEYLIGLSKA